MDIKPNNISLDEVMDNSLFHQHYPIDEEIFDYREDDQLLWSEIENLQNSMLWSELENCIDEMKRESEDIKTEVVKPNDIECNGDSDDDNDDDVPAPKRRRRLSCYESEKNITERYNDNLMNAFYSDNQDDFTNAIALELLLRSGERQSLDLHNEDVTAILRKHLQATDKRNCCWLWLDNLILWHMTDSAINNFHNIYYVFIFGYSSAPEFFFDKDGKCRHIMYQIIILNDQVPQEKDMGLVKGITTNITHTYIELTLYTEIIKK